ncbi:hypothetical protein CXR27_02760 [Brevibacterium aurantiacum]|uniref:Uncharacterized protein n=1 Tax=Brevibacterium aurantiacum TaxID=273384 RepID=A0A3Q9NVN5_BREAU|nr:hypothetical protein CXR27_02760 [Brevibacterium aurantiacum]
MENRQLKLSSQILMTPIWSGSQIRRKLSQEKRCFHLLVKNARLALVSSSIKYLRNEKYFQLTIAV